MILEDADAYRKRVSEVHCRKAKFGLNNVYLVQMDGGIKLVPKRGRHKPPKSSHVIDLGQFGGSNPYAILLLLVLFENRYAWKDGKFALCDFFGALQEIEEFRQAIELLHFNWHHATGLPIRLDEPRSIHEMVDADVKDHEDWLATGGPERVAELLTVDQ